MSESAYNILEISKNEYLQYHWKRTAKARRVTGVNEAEWHLFWEKNFWLEYAAALEKELKKTRKRVRELLEEKLEWMS